MVIWVQIHIHRQLLFHHLLIMAWIGKWTDLRHYVNYMRFTNGGAPVKTVFQKICKSCKQSKLKAEYARVWLQPLVWVKLTSVNSVLDAHSHIALYHLATCTYEWLCGWQNVVNDSHTTHVNLFLSNGGNYWDLIKEQSRHNVLFVIFKPGMHQLHLFSRNWFFLQRVCVCLPPRLLITSGMIWTAVIR